MSRHTENITPETTPLYPSSVYTFPNLSEVERFYGGNPERRFLYRRNGHPNDAPVESFIAKLEQSESAALAASGMAAISQACMAHLKPGDHVLATHHLYGGTFAFFEQVLRKWGVEVSYVDCNNIDELQSSLRTTTRLVYVESIANPLLQVADLEAIGAFCEAKKIPWFVDNTFATPMLIRPIEYGARLSIHSLTKYLNGHSDVIGGAVTGARDAVEAVRSFAITFGGTLDPFDAWQTERGLHTFRLRFAAACRNAERIALYLASHPAVRAVHYPGLPTHPTHKIARRLFTDGYGAMLSFELSGRPQADEVVQNLRHIDFAPSLGGIYTTISHPGLTSHRAYTADQRAALGISDGLLRLSVGTEPVEEILDDLKGALENLH